MNTHPTPPQGLRDDHDKAPLHWLSHVQFEALLPHRAGRPDWFYAALNALGAMDHDALVAHRAQHLRNCLRHTPEFGCAPVSRVFAFGAKKYAAWNWAQGMAWSRIVGSARRHLLAYAQGQDDDPESGLPHSAHVGCNLAMLYHYVLYNVGTDDLPRLHTTRPATVLAQEST